MRVPGPKLKVQMTTWVVPGAEQTLEGIIAKLGDRVLEVDQEKGRVLVSFSEEEIDLATGAMHEHLDG